MSRTPQVAVILAAGWGSRMLPATKSLAKPMLPIVDRPSIDYLIEDYSNAGIKEFIIVGKQCFEQIENYFESNKELEKVLEHEKKIKYLQAITKYKNLKFTYIRQNHLNGTGGALKSALHLIPANEPLIVSYADVLMYPRTPLPEMLQLFETHQGTIIPVRQVPLAEVSHYGIAKIKKTHDDQFSEIESIIEKPSIVNAPSNLALFSPMLLSAATVNLAREWPETDKKDSCNLTDIMHQSAQKNPTYIYETTAEILDTGIKSGFVKAQIRYGLENPDTKEEIAKYLTTMYTQGV